LVVFLHLFSKKKLGKGRQQSPSFVLLAVNEKRKGPVGYLPFLDPLMDARRKGRQQSPSFMHPAVDEERMRSVGYLPFLDPPPDP